MNLLKIEEPIMNMFFVLFLTSVAGRYAVRSALFECTAAGSTLQSG